MRGLFSKPQFVLGAGLLGAAIASGSARADINQIQSVAAAMQVNKTGSNGSLQESTTNAMKALMDLANQNTSSAISNGYKAFGQYQNSSQLDNMRLQNAFTGLHMQGLNGYFSNLSGQPSPFMDPPSSYRTDYARLDPAFLKQGDAAKVADQFEKATGMSRETFLKDLASASESTITADDPEMVDKVLTKFEGFLKEIPNRDFAAKVQQEIDSVPTTVRNGIIAKAIQKAAQMLASTDAKSDIAVAKPDKPASIAAAGDAAAAGAAPKATDDGDERAPASITGVQPALVGRAEYRGIDFENFGSDAVGSSLQAALDEQKGDDTIFKQVSRKYRSLTATLLKQPSL